MKCPDCGSSDLTNPDDGDYYDCNECGSICISSDAIFDSVEKEEQSAYLLTPFLIQLRRKSKHFTPSRAAQ